MNKHKINKMFNEVLQRYEMTATALIYKSSEYNLADLKKP